MERHQLPVVLADGTLHLLLGQPQLELADLLAHACQAVAVDDLSTGKDGLHGGDGGDGAILHHRHVHGTGQCGEGFGRECLCQCGTQLGRNHLLRVERHLCHAAIGVERGSGGADVGEILREGLAPLLVCRLDVVVCRPRGDVVLQRRVGELAEGEGSRYLCRQRQMGYDEDGDDQSFHIMMAFRADTGVSPYVFYVFAGRHGSRPLRFL